jgi:hypothetical protein
MSTECAYLRGVVMSSMGLAMAYSYKQMSF